MCSAMSDSLQLYGLQSIRLLCSWNFAGKNNWTAVPFSTLVYLPNPGIKPTSLMSPALAGTVFTTSTTWGALCYP